MQIKLASLLFVTAILTSSFMASMLPYANALTARTDFNDRHNSASYGNSHICGDHKCAPGEQAQWTMKIAASQKVSHGKVGTAPHGKGVMQKMAGLTPAPTTMHGNVKMTEKMSMGENMTGAGNMTKGKK